MQDNSASFFERLNNWVRSSVILKLLSVGILMLLLLIPAGMVESVIRERQYTRQNAVSEVSSKWGAAQTLTGPILTVPYRQLVRDQQNRWVETTGYAYFLPDTLAVTGSLAPEKRHRGIYDVVVYNAQLQCTGVFPAPSFQDWNIPPQDIRWNEAFVSIGITDMKGIRKSIRLQWQGQEHPLEPGVETQQVLSSGVSTRLGLAGAEAAKTRAPFRFALNLNGSEYLYFTPLGRQTTVKLTSPWPDPKFDGSFLPEARTVSDKGFTASWQVLHLNRNYPQQWRDNSRFPLQDSAFGVQLLVPVDQYQKALRSAKYAAMLISLTFLVYFFIEVLNRRRIHPVQYILVGLALCVFYTLLVALSEHMAFNAAYLVAAAAVVGLVTLYSASIFRHRLLTGLLAGILVILYGFIFTIIQLEDYALLMGSLGLFAVLAIVMYLSRKVDWYAIQSERPLPAGSDQPAAR